MSMNEVFHLLMIYIMILGYFLSLMKDYSGRTLILL